MGCVLPVVRKDIGLFSVIKHQNVENLEVFHVFFIFPIDNDYPACFNQNMKVVQSGLKC